MMLRGQISIRFCNLTLTLTVFCSFAQLLQIFPDWLILFWIFIKQKQGKKCGGLIFCLIWGNTILTCLQHVSVRSWSQMIQHVSHWKRHQKLTATRWQINGKICKHDWLKQYSKKQIVPLCVQTEIWFECGGNMDWWWCNNGGNYENKNQSAQHNKTRISFQVLNRANQFPASCLLSELYCTVWSTFSQELPRFHFIDLLKEI